MSEQKALRPSGGALDAGDQELVTCVLGDVEFGLDIHAVQEIVRLPRITPVPKSPPYVEGVANLRGNVLPIINSRARFDMPPAEKPENNRVVVVELNGSPTGLIVDAVREVMHVKARDIEPAPASVHSLDGRFLKGIVKLDGGRRLVMLLDHDAVLEEAARQEAAGPAGGPGLGASRGGQARAEEDGEGNEHLITFRLGEEEFGIRIVDVQEIIRVPAISTVPKAPPGITGVTSLRNQVLPVLDLRTRFGMQTLRAQTDGFSQKVLRCRDSHRNWCKQLERALEGGGEFEPMPDAGHCEFGRWIQSFSTTDKLLAGMTDVMRGQHARLHALYAEALALRQRDPAAALAFYRTGVEPFLQEYLAFRGKALAGLERRDDERCLVVNIGGKPLAVRVDAVNQVLQAPRSTIEQTPSLVSSGRGDQVRGIAKLDGGKRLIMLLDPSRLVSEADLAALGGPAAGHAGAAGAGAAEEDERQLVSFRVAGEEFAVEIMQVQEIIRLEKVTKVPHTPDYVEGVVNLRGNVLPVIDLRKRVHLARKDYNDATRVVVVDLAGKKTGIIVDAVSEVMRVNRRHIEPAPPIVRSTYGDHFIEGVGKLNRGERMFLLLRADSLLGDEDRSLAGAS